MRILIAEDDKDLNQLVKRRLKEADYSVDSCFDGEEVFDYLLGAEYDALVLDIMMPKLDGLQVLQRLRREGNSVPVLLLTARDSIEDRVAGLDAGADDYLIKTGVPRGEGSGSFLKGIFLAALYDAECRHRAEPG